MRRVAVDVRRDGTEPGAFAAAVRPGKTTLVFGETPANPKLDVIDLDALAIDAPTMAWDLPTGAKRFVQGSRGYRMTVAAGSPVREDDEFTGARPGHLLRGPQPA